MNENLREKRKKICKFKGFNNSDFENLVGIHLQKIYTLERGNGLASQYLKYTFILDKEIEKIKKHEFNLSLNSIRLKYNGISIKVDANSNIYHITHPDINNLRFIFANNEISIFINNCVFKDSTNLISELKLANDIIADLSNINLK